MPRPNRYQETARRLRSLMEANGIGSDSELARRVGVGRGNVGGWLKGEYRPRGKALDSLTEIFGVSGAYILGLDESGGTNSASAVSLALASVRRARAELDAVIALLEEQLTPTAPRAQGDQADGPDDDGPTQSQDSPAEAPAPKPSPQRQAQGKISRKFRRPPAPSSQGSEQATS